MRNGEARFAELWEEGRSLEVGDAIPKFVYILCAVDRQQLPFGLCKLLLDTLEKMSHLIGARVGHRTPNSVLSTRGGVFK